MTASGPPKTSLAARAATSAKRWRKCWQANVLGT